MLLLVILTVFQIKPAYAAQDFKEEITLTFVISNDYKVNIEGKIELTNVSDKKVSLTDYELVLPIVKLKNTKIIRITPDAFLIDSFRENNSNLFKIKSSAVRPAIIGPNGKVIFNFTAELDSPFKEFGQLSIFDLPFQVDSLTRHLNINVDIDKSMPLIMAPANIRSEWNTYRTSLTEEGGKTFAFLKNDMTVVIKRSSERAINHVLLHDFKDSCIAHDFMNCENCGTGLIDDRNNISFAPEDNKKPLIFTSEFKLDNKCLAQKFIKQQGGINTDPATVSKKRIVGFILYPDINTLLPTEWQEEVDIKTNVTFYSNTELWNKGFPYALDKISAFHIPVAHCDSDAECDQIKSELANTSKTISVAGQKDRIIPQLLATTAIDFEIMPADGDTYDLTVRNKSNSLGIITSLSLLDNPIFEMSQIERRIVVPGGLSHFEITPKSKVPVRNIPTDLTFTLNGSTVIHTYIPQQNILLEIIYFLGIVFLVVLGIFILSILSLVVYNKVYGIQHKA